MTPARERRLLLAAIGYARADAEYRKAWRDHRSGEVPDPEQGVRAGLARLRYRWKLKLVRAAGFDGRQPLLPLDQATKRTRKPPDQGKESAVPGTDPRGVDAPG